MPRSSLNLIKTQIVQTLRPEQKNVVLQDPSTKHTLLISGPGTGKTFAVAARIAHLISSGAAQPQEILALTNSSTNAQFIQELVDINTPLSPNHPQIKLFHYFANDLLGELMNVTSFEKHALGQYRPLGYSQQLGFLKQHLNQLKLNRYLVTTRFLIK